mmetsp:Transcript_13869/g.28625  ORF Transcript_13869/g.28625 Transcript_13869/m.28625 type:complete len:163 (+) Transcript_13869:34-522(+)|eukprot:CAMPEP_0197282200 /NCGR_PEP_ID=MMETSP1432-20130617/23819_1 /TAXON_ID=44447 /ORGANISM="Pseudo-nitzschia delicatissima, Strain UNC1205" /LENGTH=162 /DNA_ID=CAMNT_0042749105 /DNA_START=21 /DNA_END=509 /DNA_ORIENTATION=+
MKFSVIVAAVTLASASAFAPAPSQKASVALNAEAEQSRSAFLSVAGAALFGAAVAPGVAEAMDQVNVKTATEQWETGSPDKGIVGERMALYTNARTQNDSNFPPIKRLTLERKSPVTRLDINAPFFEGYKQTYPGLYKTTAKAAPAAAVEEAPAAAPAAAAE